MEEKTYNQDDFTYLNNNFVINSRLATQEEKRILILSIIAEGEEAEMRIFNSKSDDDSKIDEYNRLNKDIYFVAELNTGF